MATILLAAEGAMEDSQGSNGIGYCGSNAIGSSSVDCIGIASGGANRVAATLSQFFTRTHYHHALRHTPGRGADAATTGGANAATYKGENAATTG